MKVSRNRRRMACLGCSLVLGSVLLSGCAAVRLAGAGISVGKSAVKVTGAVGGAAVRATGSAVRVVIPDGEDPEEQKPESPDQ